jgi:hypothetical protein
MMPMMSAPGGGQWVSEGPVPKTDWCSRALEYLEACFAVEALALGIKLPPVLIMIAA